MPYLFHNHLLGMGPGFYLSVYFSDSHIVNNLLGIYSLKKQMNPQKLTCRVRNIKAIPNDYIYQFVGNVSKIETYLEHIHGRRNNFDQLLIKGLTMFFHISVVLSLVLSLKVMNSRYINISTIAITMRFANDPQTHSCCYYLAK